MSMIADIKDFINTDAGISGTIVLGGKSDDPDDQIVLYEYRGQLDDEYTSIEKPGLQVMCRSTSYETAREKLQEIKDAITSIGDEINGSDYAGGIEKNGYRYIRISSRGGIDPLGRDEKKRIELVQNYIVERKKTNG